MMELDVRNSLIYDQVISTFNRKESVCSFISEDYDKCSYQILLDRETKKISFSFNCNDFQSIFQINGPEMIKKYYSDFIWEKVPLKSYNITLSIDLNNFPQTDDKETKAKQLEIIQKHAESLAKFRRNFFASPFERAFEGVKAGKASAKCEYSCRPTEKVWIIPASDNVTVFFAISFDDAVDKAIAKLILTELEEARRQIKNSPSVTKMHEDRIPEALVQEFPTLKGQTMKFNNGLIGMTLFKHHILPNYDRPADFLQGFRQYLHYHIYASKTYLHGRIRKKVASLRTQLEQARFEEESVKLFRGEKDSNEKDEFSSLSASSGGVMRKK